MIDAARQREDFEASVASLLIRSAWVAIPVLVVDQAIKLATRTEVPLCPPSAIDCVRGGLVGSATVMEIQRAGGAFVVNPGLVVWALLVLLSLAAIPVYARLGRSGSWITALVVGLQLGGALAKGLDRLLLGGVAEHLVLGSGSVLTLADVALVAGVSLGLVGWIRPPAALRRIPSLSSI